MKALGRAGFQERCWLQSPAPGPHWLALGALGRQHGRAGQRVQVSTAPI